MSQSYKIADKPSMFREKTSISRKNLQFAVWYIKCVSYQNRNWYDISCDQTAPSFWSVGGSWLLLPR